MTRRYSQKREKILETLKHSHGALSATELHKKLSGMDLTTVYRNLELFVKDGLVKKLHFGNDEAVYEYTEEAHHHAVCTDCDKVIHFSAPDQEIKKLLDLKGFNTDSIEITVRGTCRH